MEVAFDAQIEVDSFQGVDGDVQEFELDFSFYGKWEVTIKNDKIKGKDINLALFVRPKVIIFKYTTLRVSIAIRTQQNKQKIYEFEEILDSNIFVLNKIKHAINTDQPEESHFRGTLYVSH
jgi:hypothetical protein